MSADKVPPVCSRTCELDLEKREKKQKYVQMLMFLPIAAIVIVFLLPLL